MRQSNNSHNKLLGYLLWIFGFMGSHRFYFGKPVSGTIYFFTMGIFFIGWIFDLFLIPSLEENAEFKYIEGPVSYNISWILLVFLGVFGIHRIYMGKWVTGIIYFFTAGLLGVGYLYDFWTLNEQVDQINSEYMS